MSQSPMSANAFKAIFVIPTSPNRIETLVDVSGYDTPSVNAAMMFFIPWHSWFFFAINFWQFANLARHSWGTVEAQLGHKIENSRAQLGHS